MLLTLLIGSLLVVLSNAVGAKTKFVGHGKYVKKDQGCPQALIRPRVINVRNGQTLNFDVRPGRFVVHDYERYGCNSKPVFEMTTRQYCVNNICGLPAPTLVVRPGMRMYLNFVNRLRGDRRDRTGPDVTNVHTHGLHISGKEDNPLWHIEPGTRKRYTWTLHRTHHLGTQWYHGHMHSSSALQVMGGMFGALIVEDRAGRYFSQQNQFVLQISWIFAHDQKYCNRRLPDGSHACDFNNVWHSMVYWDNGKGLMSFCALWCLDNNPQQRARTGIKYDAKLNGHENAGTHQTMNYARRRYNVTESLELFLINGKLKPHLKFIYTREWNLLRFIGASAEIYSQLTFPRDSQNLCEWWALARDGIMLYRPRNLNRRPYYGHFLLPAGGRLDVAVRCFRPGKVTINHDEKHHRYPSITKGYAMGRINVQTLFYIHVRNRPNPRRARYLRRPRIWEYDARRRRRAYYLRDLTRLNRRQYTNVCPCRNDFRLSEHQDLYNSMVCGFEFQFGENQQNPQWDVNGIPFNPNRPLFLIQQERVYEFLIYSHAHPFHIHVNPYQIMNNIIGGYVLTRGTWADTVGVKTGGFRVRMRTADFDGNYILHCHFLTHEDAGMMGFIKVIRDRNLNQCFWNCNSPRFGVRDGKCNYYRWNTGRIDYRRADRLFWNVYWAKKPDQKISPIDTVDTKNNPNPDTTNPDMAPDADTKNDLKDVSDNDKIKDIGVTKDNKKTIIVNNNDNDLYNKILNLTYVSMAYSTLLCVLMMMCLGSVICLGIRKYQKKTVDYSHVTATSASETD